MSLVERLERSGYTFMLAVGGDSGSGKTTFTDAIYRLLGDDLVATITMDDYHTEDRATRARTGSLPLNPAINDLELLADHLATLRRGEVIEKPVYNHTTGEFDPPVPFAPPRILIIEGLHPLHTERLRGAYDMSLYVKPNREVKWGWKLRRDVEERGHDRETARAEMLQREPLFAQYIDFQKVYAELVLKITPSRFGDEQVAVQLLQRTLDIPTESLGLNLDLAALVHRSQRGFVLEYRNTTYYGTPVASLVLDGHLPCSAMTELEAKVAHFIGRKAALLSAEREYLTATEMVQLLVCWRFLERLNYYLRDLERAEAG